ncbi:YdeI/OmpD-associated family protein [Pedobacter frigoris]|uniref:YdeI/OmpD-associated family protein n=1 Tax=Pedobacter frigoris TaxID=2571272 RepID=UPI0029309F6E|nr:YdeI/OmpD-associated family protein [Pedobacter frigoris]
MSKFNPAVDEYIAKSEEFAKPILKHWRQLVHNACPEVKEAIKWGFPHFDYKEQFMCVMASYKNHCAFTFLKGELMSDARLKANKDLKAAQRFLGKISQFSQLPSDEEFISFIAEAMKLNEQGIKVVTPKSEKPKVLETPDYFLAQLEQNPQAKQIFDARSDSFRKEYIAWISEAKTEATRQKRIDEALEWIAEGKARFWKYMK